MKRAGRIKSKRKIKIKIKRKIVRGNMAKNVRIPTPLRKLTNNEEVVEVKAATIGEAIV